MAGGILQISNFGSEDIFLTGAPQVTYFKLVYRRYTAFATESIQQSFNGDADFGKEVTARIDKLGDLMGRVYLQVDIPKVDLIKNKSDWTLNNTIFQEEFIKAKKLYELVRDYISLNTIAARKISSLVQTSNVRMDTITATVNDVNFNRDLMIAARNLIDYLSADNTDVSFRNGQEVYQVLVINLYNNYIQTFQNEYITSLSNGVDELDLWKRQRIRNLLNRDFYQNIKKFYHKYYDPYARLSEINDEISNGSYTERYNFAWVEELGHVLIDTVELQIGNQIIDKQTGDWLIIYNKLYQNFYQIENYDKMIGNIDELTIFDDKIKNQYRVIVPFQFYFCRFTGSAIPLISLRYADVLFTLNFKKLSDVCFCEESLNFADLNLNIQQASLYVEYIFLSSDERRRFAQSTHEYLIETVSYTEISNIQGDHHTERLYFNNPTKFVTWFSQPEFYRDNPTGHHRLQWNNFGIDNTNPIEKTQLTVNNYDRISKDFEAKYYNYVQPYLYFNRAPTVGINVFSFALKPMDFQPSGSVNMNYIDDFQLRVRFSLPMINAVSDGNTLRGIDGIYMAVYAVSINILRFASGMAGLAFK